MLREARARRFTDVIVLALDISSRAVGWAAGDTAGDPAFGRYDPPPAGKGIGPLLGAYHRWLLARIDEYRPEIVIMEKPLATISGKTNFMTKYKLASLCGQTEYVCANEDVRCSWVNVSTLKKFWTGSGRAKKPEMVQVARQLGFDTRDDNEADSLALFGYAVTLYDPANSHRWTRMGTVA